MLHHRLRNIARTDVIGPPGNRGPDGLNLFLADIRERSSMDGERSRTAQMSLVGSSRYHYVRICRRLLNGGKGNVSWDRLERLKVAGNIHAFRLLLIESIGTKTGHFSTVFHVES